MMHSVTTPEQPDLKAQLDGLALGRPERRGEGWFARYALSEDFVGFSGHFPDYKLLPAMMQVCMAAHMLAVITGAQPDIGGISTAKFTDQARPGEVIEIAAARLPDKNGEQIWDFSITKDVGAEEQSTGAALPVVASFRLSLRSA